ncbi:MAG: primosomal protein N' [Patescibacteria group bacterium]
MFAEILPLRKMPKNLDYFDYQVPLNLKSKIKLGQVVSVPFRHQNLKGIVFRLKQKTEFKNVKEVTSIIQKEPILTSQQIKLATFVADYYLASLATVLKQMAPPILKKPRAAKLSGIISRIKTKKMPEIENLADEVIASSHDKFLFFYQSPGQRLSFLQKLTLDFPKKGNQVLLIFPEIVDLENFIRYLPGKLAEKTVSIHHLLSDSVFASIYSEIKSGQAKIILGTPQSIFLPFKKLGLVIIDQEENQNHKQSEQNPRFSDKTAAEELVKLFPAKLVLITVSPNIETYFKTLNKEYSLIKTPAKTKDIRLTDLRRQASGTVISSDLKNEIEVTLKNHGRVFLFHNRRGFSRALICSDCGRTSLCPRCQVPFTFHEENHSSYLLCHRCGQKQDRHLACPNCQGVNLKNIGFGTEKVENVLKELYPQARIGRFEGKLATNLDLGRYDIIVSTHLTFKHVDWEKISLIGVISADSLLHLPDFRVQEKTFQLLSRLLSYSFSNIKSQLLIQTYNPENPALKFFPGRFDAFFREELKTRKEFKYPPFVRLIKLSSQNPSPSMALDQAKNVFNYLKNNANFSVSPPLPAFIFERFGQFRYHLVLKLNEPASPARLKDWLKIVPANWLIDVDPENLL